MREEMNDLWNRVSEQTLALNQLCRKNGFTSNINRNAYEVYEMG